MPEWTDDFISTELGICAAASPNLWYAISSDHRTLVKDGLNAPVAFLADRYIRDTVNRDGQVIIHARNNYAHALKEIRRLKEVNERLQDDRDTLSKDVSNFETDVDRLSDGNEALKDKIDELEAEVERLKDEKADLEAEVDQLNEALRIT